MSTAPITMPAQAALGAQIFHRQPDQVALIVPDIEAAASDLALVTGPGSWSGWLYDSAYLPECHLRGKPAHFVSKAASWMTTQQLELVQPVEGRSIFTDFLAETGGGLHHIGYVVDDFDATSAQLSALGSVEVQGGGGHGVDKDGRFGFFILGGIARLVIEIIQPPRQRRAPHFTITV